MINVFCMVVIYENRYDEHKKYTAMRTIFVLLGLLAAEGKVKKRPVVLSGEMRGGNWYAVGGESFLAQLFKDAGADYFLKNDKRSGGVTLDFETVYNQGDEADYWRIVNSYPGTFSYEALKSHPAWVRGLKLPYTMATVLALKSHPAWVRGLKQFNGTHIY